jgi:hypothetical protein
MGRPVFLIVPAAFEVPTGVHARFIQVALELGFVWIIRIFDADIQIEARASWSSGMAGSQV